MRKTYTVLTLVTEIMLLQVLSLSGHSLMQVICKLCGRYFLFSAMLTILVTLTVMIRKQHGFYEFWVTTFGTQDM